MPGGISIASADLLRASHDPQNIAAEDFPYLRRGISLFEERLFESRKSGDVFEPGRNTTDTVEVRADAHRADARNFYDMIDVCNDVG